MTMSKPSDCRFLTNLRKGYCFRTMDYEEGFVNFNDYADFWWNGHYSDFDVSLLSAFKEIEHDYSHYKMHYLKPDTQETMPISTISWP